MYFEYKDNFAKYKHINSKLILGDIEKNREPDITIAITTFKREKLVLEAIESAINQKKIKNYEIIVVDNDPSKNSLEDQLKKYEFNILYYKNEKNIGMFGNMNRAIELARGKYITILHDDDWLEPNFLEEAFKFRKILKKGSAINFLFLRKDFRNLKTKIEPDKIIKDLIKKWIILIKKTKKYRIKDYFYTTKGPGSLGMIYLRENLIKLGGYDEEFYPGSDYILQAKYCYFYETILIKKYLANYRILANESMKKETVDSFIKDNKNFRIFLQNKILKINLKQEIDVLEAIDRKNARFWNYSYHYKEYSKFILLKIRLKKFLSIFW